MTRAMILAAGRGERLRPLTDKTPKALATVAGEHLIDRHLKMMAAAGVDVVVINVGWLGDQIVEHVGSGEQHGLSVIYSPEYDQLLETGGGIKRALPMLGERSFWVSNADVYTDFSLAGYLQETKALDADDSIAHLIMVPTPNDKPNGDFDLTDGQVRNSTKPELTFSGIARYQPAFFSDCEEDRFPLAPLFRQFADQGKITGSLYEGLWQDIGTTEKLAALNTK